MWSVKSQEVVIPPGDRPKHLHTPPWAIQRPEMPSRRQERDIPFDFLSKRVLDGNFRFEADLRRFGAENGRGSMKQGLSRIKYISYGLYKPI